MAAYVGEIRLFAGNFEPNGWRFCNGRTLAIADNETLFQVIGTTYGGDGETTFNLPDLRGRAPIHVGTGTDGIPYIIGSTGGVESVTLTNQQIPVHSHALLATSAAGSANSPAGRVTGAPPTIDLYIEDTPSVNAAPVAVGPSGGSQPHENMQPFVCVNYIISLFGVFPSQV
jgi:microcystin-dependent protein